MGEVAPGNPEILVHPALQVVFGHWRTHYHLAHQHDSELYQELLPTILLGRRPFYYGENVADSSTIVQTRQAFVLSPDQLHDDELERLRSRWREAIEQGSIEGRFVVDYLADGEVRILFAKALIGIE